MAVTQGIEPPLLVLPTCDQTTDARIARRQRGIRRIRPNNRCADLPISRYCPYSIHAPIFSVVKVLP